MQQENFTNDLSQIIKFILLMAAHINQGILDNEISLGNRV